MVPPVRTDVTAVESESELVYPLDPMAIPELLIAGAGPLVVAAP